MHDNLLDLLLDLEHQGWRSLCDGTGAGFYGERMTADGVMVLAHGQVLDRDAAIASLGDAPPWRSYDIADERLIVLSETDAALVYTGRGYRDADEPAFVALMSSVYPAAATTGGLPCTSRPRSLGPPRAEVKPLHRAMPRP